MDAVAVRESVVHKPEWDYAHVDKKWPYTFRDEWQDWFSKHVWKRGPKPVINSERNYLYLQHVRPAYQAARNRIEAGDEVYAREYARGAAHWANLFITGKP